MRFIDTRLSTWFLEKRKDLEKDVLKREQELFDLKMKEKETQMDSLKKRLLFQKGY